MKNPIIIVLIIFAGMALIFYMAGAPKRKLIREIMVKYSGYTKSYLSKFSVDQLKALYDTGAVPTT